MEIPEDLRGALHKLTSDLDQLLETPNFDYNEGGGYLYSLLSFKYRKQHDDYFDSLKLGSSDKRVNEGLVDLLWGLHFSKLEKDIDDFLIFLQKTQKLRQNTGRIKSDNRTKVGALVGRLPDLAKDRAYLVSPTEMKIGRFQARCKTIMSGVIIRPHLEELSRMDMAVDKLLSKVGASEEILNHRIHELKQTIAALLEDGPDDIYVTKKDSPNTGTVGGTKTQERIVYPENIKFIEYIRFIRAEAITYKLSSQKGGESLGDGNFIAHVWRQFLAHLEMLAQRNIFDFSNFSWSEIVEYIYSHHDGVRNRKRLTVFLDIVIKNENKGDWQSNWNDISEFVKIYSKQDGFFLKQDGITPLSNFLEKLEQNPPPSR